MPLQDITIDTNVSNPGEKRFESAKELLERLIELETLLAIDEGFDIDPAKNHSRIGHEYLTHLVAGSIGYSVISHLAQTGRVSMVTRRLNAAINKKLNQVVSNKQDRTFVRVARNSVERTLVSHDYLDFPLTKRRFIATEVRVAIKAAQEVLGLL